MKFRLRDLTGLIPSSLSSRAPNGLLAAILFFPLVFLGCSPQVEPPAPAVSEAAVPADLQIRWGSGATHAEWGRSEGTLNAQGEWVWVESRGYGDNAMRDETQGQATQAEMAELWRVIGDNRFFDLKESYADMDIQDGFSEFIAITANGKSHSVAVMNTSQKNVSQVMGVLNKLRKPMMDDVLAENPQ